MRRSNKFKLYTINEDYIDYLKKIDSRIPNVAYNHHIKPFLGLMIESMDGFSYYAPITSYKPKFKVRKDTLDFIKIYNGKGQILGAINVNNMFPVPKEEVVEITADNISKLRDFESVLELRQYIGLLRYELKVMNRMEEKILSHAERLFYLTQTCSNHPINKRTLNFKKMETACIEWSEKMNKFRNPLDIKVSLIEIPNYFGEPYSTYGKWIHSVGYSYEIYYRDKKISSGIDKINLVSKNNYEINYNSEIELKIKKYIDKNLMKFLNKPNISNFGKIMRNGIIEQTLSEDLCSYIELDELLDSYKDSDIKQFNKEIIDNDLELIIESFVDNIEQAKNIDGKLDYAIGFMGDAQCRFNLLTKDEYENSKNLLQVAKLIPNGLLDIYATLNSREIELFEQAIIDNCNDLLVYDNEMNEFQYNGKSIVDDDAIVTNAVRFNLGVSSAEETIEFIKEDKHEFNDILMKNKYDELFCKMKEYGYDVEKNKEYYIHCDFDGDQLEEIYEGLEAGIDVDVYAKDIYDPLQMGEIKAGLISGVDVEQYTNMEYDSLQMYQIREGLEQGLDVSEYADLKYSADQMEEIREELLQLQEEMSL